MPPRPMPDEELEWLRAHDPRLFTTTQRDRLFDHIDALTLALARLSLPVPPEPPTGEPPEELECGFCGPLGRHPRDEWARHVVSPEHIAHVRTKPPGYVRVNPAVEDV